MGFILGVVYPDKGATTGGSNRVEISHHQALDVSLDPTEPAEYLAGGNYRHRWPRGITA